MHGQGGHAGETVGPEGATTARSTGAARRLANRKRATEERAGVPKKPTAECSSRSQRPRPYHDGEHLESSRYPEHSNKRSRNISGGGAEAAEERFSLHS